MLDVNASTPDPNTPHKVGATRFEPQSVRYLAASDLNRAILLIATCLQAEGNEEEWEFRLHSAGQDEPLCSDLKSFTTPASGDIVRGHATTLYGSCPFTLDFRAVLSNLGFATALLRTENHVAQLGD